MQRLRRVIRSAHVRFLARALPKKLAIYFHEFERGKWGEFEKCVRHFQDHGYSSASAEEFASDTSGRRLLFISFDDNFAGWHAALPLFDRLGISVTCFTNTLPIRGDCSREDLAEFMRRIDYRGGDSTLTRAQIKEIAEGGHTIGCHSHSHHPLVQLSEARWHSEIVVSKHVLEDLLEREVVDFSYPYGMRRFFSGRLRKYCVSAGFRTISTGIPGLQIRNVVNPLEIHRTRWRLDRCLDENLEDLAVDGRIFERITGRSPIGCGVLPLYLPSIF